MRVLRLDQIDLPIPPPSFDLAFAGERPFKRLVRFEPDETGNTVLLREAGNGSDFVFPNPAREGGRGTDVERSGMPARPNVEQEQHARGSMGAGLRRDPCSF